MRQIALRLPSVTSSNTNVRRIGFGRSAKCMGSKQPEAKTVFFRANIAIFDGNIASEEAKDTCTYGSVDCPAYWQSLKDVQGRV